MNFYGGIEAGGTKMVCAVCDENAKVVKRATIPTTTPDETISEMIAFFKENPVKTLGIATFGPVDLNPKSNTYGCIMRTPKEGWTNFNMVKPFESALDIPVAIDTDVNGAIYAEVRTGAAIGSTSAIYITIGTGIGVGVYVNGGLLHGLIHPEGGHILLKRHKEDTYLGCCPFHKECFEGLASGPAIVGRWGKLATDLHDNPLFFDVEGGYIADAITNYILTYSPEKVILWGGVIQHNPELFPVIREKVVSNLNGYVVSESITKDIDSYIIPPALEADTGVIGAMLLGKE